MDDHLCLVPIHILSWVVHGPSHPGHGPGVGNHDLAHHGLVKVLGLEQLPGLHVDDDANKRTLGFPEHGPFSPFCRSDPLPCINGRPLHLRYKLPLGQQPRGRHSCITLGTCRGRGEPVLGPSAVPRPFSAHIPPNSLALKGTSHHCSLLSCALGPLRHGRPKICCAGHLQGSWRASLVPSLFRGPSRSHISPNSLALKGTSHHWC